MADQAVIDSALEAIQEKRRTLREARWRQQQVKMGRKFYPSGKVSTSWSRTSSNSYPQKPFKAEQNVKCVRSGGPHNASNCPVPRKQQAQVTEEAEVAFQAESHWFAFLSETANVSSDVSQTIQMGKGIVDRGATATLGSIEAVEALMRKNMSKHGDDRLSVDPSNTPIFKFGNNGATSCVSTAQVQVDCGAKVGNMTIHVHELPNQPILISIKALRSLGAIVDFSRNEVIYKSLCPHSVVKLESASNGHLLMPLGDDLLQGAQKRSRPFSTLSDE